MAEWPPNLDNVNVILGINGVGKSTILDAVALAVLAPVISEASGFSPYSLVRRSPGDDSEAVTEAELSAEILLHEFDNVEGSTTGADTVTSRAVIAKRGSRELMRADTGDDPIWNGMFYDDTPAFFMVGYSAKRRVESLSVAAQTLSRKQRDTRYQRVAGLFEEHFAVTPLTHWLPDLETRNPKRQHEVIELINALLPDGTQFRGEMEDGEYLFEHRGVDVRFGALSDGYRGFIGWIGDMLYHICEGCPDDTALCDLPGIVLIDEVDLHIHPEWQLAMIPTLAAQLPMIQFIFTTHSALVTGTLKVANMYHLRQDGPVTEAVRPEDSTYGLTADQVLRSDLFGLETTRDKDFSDGLKVLARKASSGDLKAADELMRKSAIGLNAQSSGNDDEIEAWVRSKAKLPEA